jgi:AmmeMemoRadiSam system protein A
MVSLDPSFSEDEGRILLRVARGSIENGLREGKPSREDASGYPPALRDLRATFVTLRRQGDLRGCVGSLEARHPLVVDVAENAFKAAFTDTRLPSIEAWEIESLDVHISILSPLEPVTAPSEAILMNQLRPGVDGLVLREGLRRSTFLPSVWESLSDPREFLRELKLKAGLPEDYWSETLAFQRYTVVSIP